MRRKPGQLLDLEARILAVAVEALVDGDPPEVHGFAVAKRLADREGSQRLTSHGTLYKALARLEEAGLLSSRWEDHEVAQEAGRPRRRLYRVTSPGQAALADHASMSEPTMSYGPGAFGRGVEPT